MYSQSMFGAKKKKILKIFIFYNFKNLCILHGRVFVMPLALWTVGLDHKTFLSKMHKTFFIFKLVLICFFVTYILRVHLHIIVSKINSIRFDLFLICI